MSFLILMYPRPYRAKNGVFSTATLPVPLRLSNVAEIDVILGSGAARSMPFCPGGVCLPTQIAGRRRPWDQYGVSGVYAAVLAC